MKNAPTFVALSSDHFAIHLCRGLRTWQKTAGLDWYVTELLALCYCLCWFWLVGWPQPKLITIW